MKICFPGSIFSNPWVKPIPRKGGTSKALTEGGTMWILCIVSLLSLQFWKRNGKNDFNRVSEAANSLGGRAALSIPAPKMTVNMQERMHWEAECDGWVRRCSGNVGQQLRQNGHFWRQVWTWHTKRWDTVKSLPDLFTSFTNWALKPCRIFIYLLLLAKFCPFDAW